MFGVKKITVRWLPPSLFPKFPSKEPLQLKNHTIVRQEPRSFICLYKDGRRFEFIDHQLRITLKYVSSKLGRFYSLALNDNIKHSESARADAQLNNHRPLRVKGKYLLESPIAIR